MLIDVYIHLYTGDAETVEDVDFCCDTAGGSKIYISFFVSADKEGAVVYFIASFLLYERR